MFAKLLLLALIACQFLLRSGDCFEAKRFFGVGQRIPGDQLLVKDVRHSRPAGSEELPRVDFTYEILEPITSVEILSEENIAAEVIFSLVNRLIVGMVRLAGSNESGVPPPTMEFDVTIMVFGLNDTTIDYDPSMIVNPDQQYEGEMEPFDDPDLDQILDTEVYDNNKRAALEVEEMEEGLDKDESYDEIDEHTEGLPTDHIDNPDKIIEVGQRQLGDQMLFECYLTTPDDSEKQSGNLSVTFYYIDNDSITYVKFVIIDHFENNNLSDPRYISPVAEYSHFSSGTLKAVITDFDAKNLFVQMFIYGYRANEVPASYVPFLPPPHWQRKGRVDSWTSSLTPALTPVQTMQLLLMTGQMTTPPAVVDNDTEEPRSIRPEEMEMVRYRDNSPNSPNSPNSALRLLDRGLGACLGVLPLLLLGLH